MVVVVRGPVFGTSVGLEAEDRQEGESYPSDSVWGRVSDGYP